MPPQNRADELVRDGAPEVVTEVRGRRLAVVLGKISGRSKSEAAPGVRQQPSNSAS